MVTLHEFNTKTTTEKFAELHTISNFSFLRGASHPEELVNRAHILGYQAIAITDECSITGIVKAHVAAKECNRNGHGIKLIVGSEFHLNLETQNPDINDDIHLVLLVPSRLAYGQLTELITRARRRARKGEYELHFDDFRWGIDECLALWIPKLQPISKLIEQGRRLQTHFSKLWISLEVFLEPTDIDRAANALILSSRLKIPIVASNDVHMHVKQRKPLQDVLTAIRKKTPVAKLGRKAQANSEHYMRPIERLGTLYPKEMLRESVEISNLCNFSLDELRYEYPEELVPSGLKPSEYLRQLTYIGAKKRWPNGMPTEVDELIEKELALIKSLSYEYYFLTVYDIVHYARSLNILCQGRGSAANSAVCYCLYITEVDPSRMHLLFERFVSKERNKPPDIDVDFEHERREEVIQYLYKRYGRHRAALTASLITYQMKSAIRDVGKALDFDLDLLEILTKSIAWWDKREGLDERFRAVGIDPKSKISRQFFRLVNEILGFPRHLSQHVGGFVISRGPLTQLVPIENAAMKNRTIIQWDKEDIESLGLLKIDVLGLGMLTAIRKTLALINQFRRNPQHPNRKNIENTEQQHDLVRTPLAQLYESDLTVDRIPPEDPETYSMLQHGDSVGVFQVESRAQMSMLPRLQPNNFYDLVIEVGIVRPGPIQGNMVHPYLRRREGLEPVTYSSESVRKVLERTLGIPIFQEQVIELAMVAAGFTAGEADQLRRAMTNSRRRGGLEHFKDKLIQGMLHHGNDLEFAERVFQQIRGFGKYGFPESHAASFALLVYISAWLKRHEPSAFYCGLLNSLPMGFYTPSQLLQDAVAHGIEVREVDVQNSTWDYLLESRKSIIERTGSLQFCDPTLEQPAIRLGLRQIKGLREDLGNRIATAQPFVDIDDLARRASLSKQQLYFLARAGALKHLTGHRYQAHWDTAGIDNPSEIWKAADAHQPYETDVQLDSPTNGDDLLADYRYLGLTLGTHPMGMLREDREFHGYKTASDLITYRQNQFVKVAGIVTCRQRPGSAGGVVFLTLEDETGNTNIVVWKSVLERNRSALLQGQLLAIKGVLERKGRVIHVVAGHIFDMTYKLAELSEHNVESEQATEKSFPTRNFH